MKIGVITFHASFNYGSMLQAYALQTYLQREGHEVEIINYRPKKQKTGYPKSVEFSSLHNAKQSIMRLLLAPSTIKPLNQKWHLFDKFMHEKLNLTKEYNTFDELKCANFDYDVLITGSDQIWNTNAFDFSEAYFGTFVNNNHTIKVSYAPSMGPKPEKQNVEYLRSLLKDFKAVSVREERTKDFLVNNGICDNVSIVLDPTMLLDASDYDQLYDDKPLIDGQYIFYYTPGSSPRHEFLQEAAYIGRQWNLPVICDTCYTPKALNNYDNIKSYIATGPIEFLNLIKNATVVCGASFHLIVFSIIFRKNFYCMNGDVDSRLNNLMKTLHLENCIWSIKDKKNNRLEPIVYSDALIDTYSIKKKESVEYIFKALKEYF